MPEAKFSDVDQSKAEYWREQISTYERTFAAWEKRVKGIVNKYRDQNDQAENANNRAKFNILWSNVQTLCAATYAKLPKADVSRRFNDNDPVGRVASLILERALDYEISHYPDYAATLQASVLDRFLGARATSWVRYDPKFKESKTTEVQVTEDVESEVNEELEYECAPCDYVHWKDFGHVVARTWEEVPAVWRRVFMTKEAMVERFGEDIGNKIPLDARPEEFKEQAGDTSQLSRGLIYEIWDKENKKAFWLAKSLGVVDEKDDPLKLVNFFPCPRPLYGTLGNDTLVPTPDYAQYQYQAQTLDLLAQRIEEYCDAMRVVGTYDGSLEEIKRVFTDAGNTQMVPVKNWAAYAEKGGVQGAIQFTDLKPIYEALQQSYTAVEQIKNQIYEITRISDIMRGTVDPREKLGQSQLKSQYGNLGLHAYQWQVAKYATELLQIKAQIICNKFDPKTIIAISAAGQLLPKDQEVIPQAMALLLGPRLQDPNSEAPNPLRSFRVEVAADSLVQLDESEEREARMSLLKVNSDFLKEFMVAAQAGPMGGILAPLVMEQWKFGMTAFHVGKSIEGAFDEATEKLQQLAAAPKPPPPPDPQLVRVQEDAKLQAARLQAEQQNTQQEQQFEVAKFQAETQQSQQESQAKAQIALREAELKAETERHSEELSHQRELQKMSDERAFQEWKVKIEAETKIEIALIQAGIKTSDGSPRVVDWLTKGMKDIKDSVSQKPVEIDEINAERDANGDMVGAQIKRSDGSVRKVKMRLNQKQIH